VAGTILLVILILLLIRRASTVGLQQRLGYYPSDGIGLVLIIIIILYTIAARVRLALSLLIGFQDPFAPRPQRDRTKLAGSTNLANIEWSSPAGGHTTGRGG
jgi:hypothetical protein